MGKILNGLKALGQQMTGRPIQSNKIGSALNEIAENYSGGGSGGAVVLDGFLNYVSGSYYATLYKHYDQSTDLREPITDAELQELKNKTVFVRGVTNQGERWTAQVVNYMENEGIVMLVVSMFNETSFMPITCYASDFDPMG